MFEEELNLEDGPVLFENGPYTVGVRMLEDNEPEFRDGYVVELGFWVVIDEMRCSVASAYVDREAEQVDVWFDDHDDDLDDDPRYIEAIGTFDHVLRDFVRTSRALITLDADLSAWAKADPDNPFGDTPPAEDPIDYEELDDDAPRDVHDILREFGVSFDESGVIKGIYSLTDEQRQRMYVQLKKLQRQNEQEDW